MIIEEIEGKFSITLSEAELWIIASQCGQGVIYGMEDSSDETLSEATLELGLQSLKDAGVIWTGPDGVESIDELVFGMVYSCMYSHDMLTIQDGSVEKSVYLHFLPDWNLSFTRVPDGYLLTYYQNRDTLHKHIMTNYLSDLREADSQIYFSCTRVALEAASYLFETDKHQEGIALLAEFMEGDDSKSEAFLEDIAAGQKYEVKAYFDRLSNHNAVGYQTDILIGKNSNYLVRRIFSVDKAREVLSIQGLPSELVRHSVYQLLPKG
jgi:hypothetical protein